MTVLLGDVTPWPTEACVHELIEAHVARDPSAPAVVLKEAVISYGELNARANRLARTLLELGVGPGVLVAACVQRSLEMVVGLLAVLKAGGAYVPLDPAYPAERLAYLLADAAPRVVLTQTAVAARLPAHEARVVILDEIWPHMGTDPTPNLPRGASAADLAYVIYTSGSTGAPKGTMVEHGNVVNYLVWAVAAYGLKPGGVAPVNTSIAFDATVTSVWAPLAAGAAIRLLPEGPAELPALGELLASGSGTSVVKLTPMHLEVLAQLRPDAARPGAAGVLVIGGEALSARQVELWRRHAPDVRLVNEYGPTEATVGMLIYEVDDATPWDGSVPVGRPIANTRVYLLDASMRTVPVGEIGEIYIGGAGVARGYLNRPELTAERFVPSPFASGDRLYKTGDLARSRADGAIEFLGRNDHQVKVRGFRVELGEIEARLIAHPAVARAAVVLRADATGAPQLVAYTVPTPGVGPDRPTSTAELRAFVGTALPEFMVPAVIVWLDTLPLTVHGKLDTSALPAPPALRARDVAGEFVVPRSGIERDLAAVWEAVLGVDRVGATDSFFELGGTSRLAVLAVARAREAHGLEISVVSMFERLTVRALAEQVGSRGAADASPHAAPGARIVGQPTGVSAGPARDGRARVAIVGMAARFPGAPDVDAFWRNLLDGVDSVSRFTPGELAAAGVNTELLADPQYVPARGVLADVDRFDAGFFGLGPREAQLMDPQHRLFLELAWEALEHAGCDPGQQAGPVGVFGGVYTNSYLTDVLARRPDVVARYGAFNTALLNEKDYVATRAAHALGLTGPALSIHTACSTSLVAICAAVESLRAEQCDVALAGAVSLTLPTASGHLHVDGGMLSVDGRTRPFDAQGSGTVFSDGAGMVVLKRLDDALRDGDTVHAVVRGVGLNNDGAEKASFTAPSVRGQAGVIRMAHADAGVAPREISYVEAHGTATPLGDPIEFEALARVFGPDVPAPGCVGLGSVKSNVGHTVAAAGVAGVLKTALALTHECIPASLHYTAPNPALGLAESPFRVVAERTAWPRGAVSRLAGVSSFGVGGTNAHVVLEEPPARPPSESPRGAQLLVVSARTPAALERATDNLVRHLRAPTDGNAAPNAALADVAHTLRVGRRAFPHRRAVVAASASEAATALAERDTRRVTTHHTRGAEPGVVFAFPGQGAQYPRMGATLYRDERAYRDAFDRCAESARRVLDRDLRALLFDDGDGAAEALRQTAVTQPALFATGYALAVLWESWGVRPRAMVGHSVGEFVAAALAGVFSPEDGMRLVAERGRMMQQLPAGSMLSVRLAAASVAARLGPELAIASDNGPALCVVAGPTPAVAALQEALEAEGVACRPLHTSHAFHSPMMEPAIAPFLTLVRGTALAPARTPIVSSVTGTWLSAEQACDPEYWARHLRETVRFADAVRTVWSEPDALLLEVGPRATLSTLARQQATDRARQLCVASLGDAGDPAAEGDAVLAALGRLWTYGVRPHWHAMAGAADRRRVPLPTYPFERARYWVDPIDASPSSPRPTPSSGSHTLPSLEVHPPSMPASAVTPSSRQERLAVELGDAIEQVSGVAIGAGDAGATFVELGLDSLALTQVALALSKRYGVKITFRQLLEAHSSLERLAAFLDAQLPRESAPAAAPVATVASTTVVPSIVVPTIVAPSAVAPGARVVGGAVQQLIEQQLRVMEQQLALLAGAPPAVADAVVPAVAAAVVPVPAPMPVTDVGSEPAGQAPAGQAQSPLTTGPQREFYDAKKAFGAAPRITLKATAELDARQRARLDAFTRRYTVRTQKSKQFTQANRARMADPRVATGFRPLTKELVYPLVMERSAGSRMWDLDGNEYVDVLSGFGSNLFGWSAPFVVEAVKRQLDLGFDVGPQHPLAAEVAELFAEVTGTERVAFCNTGSEAVLGAIRIARTVTGRSTVAIFSGSYHGINDEVIVRGTRTHRAVPAAPGILGAATENVLVLDYGTPESMAVLRERAHELAAIVVEPVQSRRPDFQPAEFLRELRTLTEQEGIVYVWDEVITGFRAALGGAQEHFGVRGDLATYGKIVGGGLPIGVIAGKREFMDALDGGAWQFGDASVPEVGVTYFAGTFVRHPLALAAAKVVLQELKARGPDLQRLLAQRTRDLADELNAMFRASGAPLEIRHFASLWKTFYTAEQPHGDLLFYMLRDRGVHVYDGFPCFMTASHSDADLRLVVDAFTNAVAEMQEGGFLPPRPAESAPPVLGAPPVPGARLGRARDGSPAWFVAHPNEPGRYVQVGGP